MLAVVLNEVKDLMERSKDFGAGVRSFAALQGGGYPARDDKGGLTTGHCDGPQSFAVCGIAQPDAQLVLELVVPDATALRIEGAGHR